MHQHTHCHHCTHTCPGCGVTYCCKCELEHGGTPSVTIGDPPRWGTSTTQDWPTSITYTTDRWASPMPVTGTAATQDFSIHFTPHTDDYRG